ncbi:hypothetical protein fugu_014979 [Takifugu bimaculatus]|uniref:C-factor n=1 Tax=Takifugu bimaculatus TaxID=433685 RepID=A0A4Z2BXB8_9TELE|nr:hypothetical protein fugu_014979 [Takifugu bimaculatus]
MEAGSINVLITGTNRGLGLEMVRLMVEGSIPVKKLIACCRDPDGPRAEALQTLGEQHPDIISIVPLDISDICSIKGCAQRVGALVGSEGLNLLVNNAGIINRSPLLESSCEDMRTLFNTNILGPMNMIKEFLPLLRTAAESSKISGMSIRKAAVVSISSLLGSVQNVTKTYENFSAAPYRVSKCALNMLTMCAAMELRKDEILFSLLHPGWVRTDMGGKNGLIDAPESVQKMFDLMASMTEKHNGSFLDYQGQTIAW